MSKAAARWRCSTRGSRAGRSLAAFLGSEKDRVPCGGQVGIAPSPEATSKQIRGYLGRVRRVKLKIEPGRDVGT